MAIVLEATQSAVEAMLRHASSSSPYYRQETWSARLRDNRKVCFPQDIPVTPKSLVRDETELFYAETHPRQDGKTIDKYTSGSTGEPMLVKKTIRHFHINAGENERLKQGWELGRQRKTLAIKSAHKDVPFGTVEETVKNGYVRSTLWGLD